VWLKLETDLPTRSFKPRGALWALSVAVTRRPVREVVACSTGNHGAAVAFAAKALGVAATVFVQTSPNPVKRARITSLGASVEEVGDMDLAEAFAAATDRARAECVYFLDDATDPDVPAGPGTIALEIVEQLPSVDTIVVPIGDTALVRGVAVVARLLAPGVRIIGVQAERAPAYTLSWRAGRAVPTERCDTIADGLATRLPDAENVRAIRELVDDIVLASDGQMLAAMRRLAIEERVVAEPAGAAAAAALLNHPSLRGRQTVALVTGANVECRLLRAALRGGP
jgi:threonine dehydratase